MKKNILILVLIFTFIGINAQTKITGFGKLRLGSQISIINEMGYNVEIVSSNDYYYSNVYKNFSATKIFELVADSSEKYIVPGSYFDKRVRCFFVPKYSVTDLIEIKSVELKFFNDKLISISCDGNNKLDEALTLKYGDPKIELKEKEHTFTYTYNGNTIVKTDQTFTSKWETNDSNIICVSTLMKWYSDKGEENILSYVQLSDNSHNEEIRIAETLILKDIEDRKLLKKKQALEGF